MSGPTHSWDQPEDPRESTINLPRIVEGTREQQEPPAESRSDLASWQGRTIRPPAAPTDSRRQASPNRQDGPEWPRSDPPAANGDTGLYRLRTATGDGSGFFDAPASRSPDRNGSADHGANYRAAGYESELSGHQAQFSAWRQPSNGTGAGSGTPFRQPTDSRPPADGPPDGDRRRPADSWQPADYPRAGHQPGEVPAVDRRPAPEEQLIPQDQPASDRPPARQEGAARPAQPGAVWRPAQSDAAGRPAHSAAAGRPAHSDAAVRSPQPAAVRQRVQPEAGVPRSTDADAEAPLPSAHADPAPPDTSPADLSPVDAARDMAPPVVAPLAEVRPETGSPEIPEYRIGPVDRSQRPARGSLADMRRRLLLLPDGHPSSHFEDGGARRPPPPRVRHFELPLTEDEREADQPAATGPASANGSPRASDVAEQVAGLTAKPGADPGAATVAPAYRAADGSSRAPSQQPDIATTSEYARPGRAGGERDRSRGSAESALTLSGTMYRDPYAAADRPARNGSAGQDTAIASRPAGHDDQPAVAGALTPQQERIADQMLAECRTAEGRRQLGDYGQSGLTPAMMRVAEQLSHGGLAPRSEHEALKSPDRFKQKLARLIARHPDTPVDQLAAEICDTIRYAFVFAPEHYTDGAWQVHRRLSASGFELEARRNRWESPESKGIRTRWRDPAHDVVFEVQFHTPASWDVQQQTHEAYLRIIDPATLPAERATLRARRVAAATAAKPPPGWTEVADFRADIR
jgi:hypothetical protein